MAQRNSMGHTGDSRRMSILQGKGKKGKECSVVTDAGLANYGGLMRRYAESQVVKCNYPTANSDTIKQDKPIKTFPTGSVFEGTWDSLGMSGYGTYIFPSEMTMFEGDFVDGLFHGDGEFKYKAHLAGVTLKGTFDKGVMTERLLIFADGLEYAEKNWKYTHRIDRRFTDEFHFGIQPAGESIMCPVDPPPEIPDGMYDTCDGIYNPKTKLIHRYEDTDGYARWPIEEEQKWIMANCRFEGETFGPRPELYHEWLLPELDLEKPPLPAVKLRHMDEEEFDMLASAMSLTSLTFQDFEDNRSKHRRSTITQRRKLLFYNIDEHELGK